MDNKFELVFNERDDAAELKNLPIDDTMHGIIEEEELEDEVSDEEEDADKDWKSLKQTESAIHFQRQTRVCVLFATCFTAPYT